MTPVVHDRRDGGARLRDVLAVVPARGGSKGIPRKNLADVGGRPLIAWTVAAAAAAACRPRVVVSTDDDEIAAAAREAGAEVPFRRAAELADDGIHAVHVVLDALDRLERSESYVPDATLMLLPTAPLRRGEHVDGAVELLRRHPGSTVVGVYQWAHYPTNLRYQRDGRLVPVVTADDFNVQRQDQEELYVVNGAIFGADTAVLRECRTFHTPDALAYVMSARDSVDINDAQELDLARRLLTEGGEP